MVLTFLVHLLYTIFLFNTSIPVVTSERDELMNIIISWHQSIWQDFLCIAFCTICTYVLPWLWWRIGGKWQLTCEALNPPLPSSSGRTYIPHKFACLSDGTSSICNNCRCYCIFHANMTITKLSCFNQGYTSSGYSIQLQITTIVTSKISHFVIKYQPLWTFTVCILSIR